MAAEPQRHTAPRRTRRRTTDDGRRALTAGHALAIALLALVVGCLLNAPGMHKNAYNQPDGWKRNVALAITGPLADVSHALLLDRPRKLLQDALGRGDDDKIDTAVTFTPTTPAPTPKPKPKPTPKPATGGHTGKTGTTTPPPEKPSHPKRAAFSPKHKLRLWIAGDSLVITPGWAIIRAAGRAHAILPVGGGPDGRVGTGLERPDIFNWFTHIQAQARALHPNAVVLDFGGNDDHGYMTGLPKGVSVTEFGSASWAAEYRRRVGGLLDSLNRAGAFVVWIGLPITRDEAQTRRFDTINGVIQSEARKRPGRVTYVDTYTAFANDSGGFAQYLTDSSGKQILVRAPDGVHFEPAGGDIIARSVLHALNVQFDLTSWKRKHAAGG